MLKTIVIKLTDLVISILILFRISDFDIRI
jgi:hypothetical protein